MCNLKVSIRLRQCNMWLRLTWLLKQFVYFVSESLLSELSNTTLIKICSTKTLLFCLESEHSKTQLDLHINEHPPHRTMVKFQLKKHNHLHKWSTSGWLRRCTNIRALRLCKQRKPSPCPIHCPIRYKYDSDFTLQCNTLT